MSERKPWIIIPPFAPEPDWSLNEYIRLARENPEAASRGVNLAAAMLLIPIAGITVWMGHLLWTMPN